MRGNIRSFADDTTIFYKRDNQENQKVIVESDKSVIKWLAYNNSLSPQKIPFLPVLKNLIIDKTMQIPESQFNTY